MGTDTDLDLGQVSTEWSLVFQAHGGSPEEVAAAQYELMERYAGAVHRYLRSALGDRELARDLDQEFAVRFLRGDFHRADPARGRFRDFVKRSLRNLMIEHRRRAAIRPRAMGDDLPEPVDALTGDRDFENRFLASWRAELLARAWAALERLEVETGQPYHTVLLLRVENPDLHSPELASRLSTALSRPVSAGGLRMLLQRSRAGWAEFLLKEVSESLLTATADELEQELIDLGLLKYCRPYLKRRGSP